MKTEPDVFSYEDLLKAKNQTSQWEGVRNYQARNFMRDEMQKGDLAFFYHSNSDPSGVAGIMKICSDTKPDLTQFEKKSMYYDKSATKKEPRWFLREVEFVKKLDRIVSISELRKISACKNMATLQKGSRLSITPVTKEEWDAILAVK
jgi:predicted RNA-binding protein with PUA-like domain